MSHWIKIHKSITENPYWASETFSRGQAWVDMLLLANTSPSFVRKQGMRIDLERGDLGWSEIELSKRWQWSRGKVRRFIDELELDGMICRKNRDETDRRKFVITIVNYCKFQDKQMENSTGERTSDNTSGKTGKRTGDGQAAVQEVRITDKQNISLSKKQKFIPPSVEEVKSYCEERKNGIDAQYFVDSNSARGWVVGKNQTPMKDWRAAIRTWESRTRDNPQKTIIPCPTCQFSDSPICAKKPDEKRIACPSFREKAA